MKIALALYQVNNIGGIVNHTELLAKGFRDLGHEVHLVQLFYQGRFVDRGYKAEEVLKKPGYEMSGFGFPVSQEKGWMSEPWKNKFAYYGEDKFNRTKEFLSSMDLIVWEIPVPTKQRGNFANLDWIKLYDIPVKQVGIIHDGNFRKSYPWLNAIKKHLKGIACVHPCAYKSADSIDIPRALIVNPQDLSNMYTEDNWNEREKGFLSIQTFKAWKHVDGLLRAIPYISNNTRKVMGGGGVEYAYMTSKDKFKKRYTLLKSKDPDLPDELDDKNIKIFDYAKKFGMEWVGWINGKKRDEILRKMTCLIDPSWNLKYASMGDHFNRTPVDALLQGAIPIAKNMGISDNLEGNGVLFKPGKNYIMVPYDATPKEFAQIIEYACHLDKNTADTIRENNFELAKTFDHKKIAQDFINLSNGIPCGIYNKLETGVLTKEVEEGSDYAINGFFSGKDLESDIYSNEEE